MRAIWDNYCCVAHCRAKCLKDSYTRGEENMCFLTSETVAFKNCPTVYALCTLWLQYVIKEITLWN